jgi:hypothetical protein
MDRLPMNSSWRKPAGMFLILALIAVWAMLVATAAQLIEGLPDIVHILYYLTAGIVWILPLKPLLLWMETGRWRAPKP